jgi:hypothetical protein
MYRDDIYPANAADRHSKKLKQEYIWLCLMMVVVFTILKLFTGSMDVFFCETFKCRRAFINVMLTIVGGMFLELTEAQMNLALWRYLTVPLVAQRPRHGTSPLLPWLGAQ